MHEPWHMVDHGMHVRRYPGLFISQTLLAHGNKQLNPIDSLRKSEMSI